MIFQGKKNSGQRKGIIPVNLGFRLDELIFFWFWEAYSFATETMF